MCFFFSSSSCCIRRMNFSGWDATMFELGRKGKWCSVKQQSVPFVPQTTMFCLLGQADLDLGNKRLSDIIHKIHFNLPVVRSHRAQDPFPGILKYYMLNVFTSFWGSPFKRQSSKRVRRNSQERQHFFHVSVKKHFLKIFTVNSRQQFTLDLQQIYTGNSM